jgi:tripartite-type tricarboxylate transporter receptor subunit TctC
VKAPALLAAKRARLLPDLATAQEQGMVGFDAGSWNVVFFPKGTPESIVRKLNSAISAAMDSPKTEKRLLAIGVDIPAKSRRTPAYAASFVASEIKNTKRRSKGAVLLSNSSAGFVVHAPADAASCGEQFICVIF